MPQSRTEPREQINIAVLTVIIILLGQHWATYSDCWRKNSDKGAQRFITYITQVLRLNIYAAVDHFLMNTHRAVLPIAQILSVLSRGSRSHADLAFLDLHLCGLRDMQQYSLLASEAQRWRLWAALRVQTFDPAQDLFRKGDVSEKLYLVLEGAITLWKVGEEGRVVKLTALETGRIIGEKGLLRGSFCMLNATAESYTVTATLDQDAFRACLAPFVTVRIAEKLAYMDVFIPGIRQLVSSTKEHLAFALNLLFCRRGEVLVVQGSPAESLYFICAGECVVMTGKHVVMRVGPGCCLGGDSLLPSARSEFAVTVASESLSVYQLHRSDSMVLLSAETQMRLVEQYRKRLVNWRAVARQFPQSPKSPTGLPPFPQASPPARRHLLDLSIRLETLRTEESNAKSTAYLHLRSKLLRNKEAGDLPKLVTRSNNSSPRRVWDN